MDGELPACFDRPGPHAVIIVNQRSWRAMSPHQKKALIHHELCHCFGNHDVAEFRVIAERYGAWNDTLEDFAVKIQPSLPGVDDEDVTPIADGKPTKVVVTAESARNAKAALDAVGGSVAADAS